MARSLTMFAKDGAIGSGFYPVFPPNERAQRALGWLSARDELEE